MKGLILTHNKMSGVISRAQAPLVVLSELSGELTKHYAAALR